MKLAVHKETGECVAVKIVEVDEKREGGLTHEALRKEVWSIGEGLGVSYGRDPRCVEIAVLSTESTIVAKSG